VRVCRRGLLCSLQAEERMTTPERPSGALAAEAAQ
jgi:hypothetical protein